MKQLHGFIGKHTKQDVVRWTYFLFCPFHFILPHFSKEENTSLPVLKHMHIFPPLEKWPPTGPFSFTLYPGDHPSNIKWGISIFYSDMHFHCWVTYYPIQFLLDKYQSLQLFDHIKALQLMWMHQSIYIQVYFWYRYVEMELLGQRANAKVILLVLPSYSPQVLCHFTNISNWTTKYCISLYGVWLKTEYDLRSIETKSSPKYE